MCRLGSIRISFLILLLLAIIACTTHSEEPLPNIPSLELFEVKTATPAPVATSTSVLTATPEPPAAPMTPATPPEPGSDEGQIMAVLEKQVGVVNAADFVAFQKTCTPTAKKLPTISYLKYLFEDNRGVTDQFGLINFSPQGYNIRNIEVTLLRAPFAQASFDVYDYDRHMGAASMNWSVTEGEPVTRTFEKVDGQWYSEVAPC